MMPRMDFRWWLLMHHVGITAFLVAHGVSVFVLFRLRRERDRDRIRELLQFSGTTVLPMYISLAILIAGGAGLATKLGFWEFKWIRISLGLLIGEILFMGALARPYYRKIKESLLVRPSGVPRVADEDLAARLMAPQPIIIATAGFGGLLAILSLMVFKPL